MKLHVRPLTDIHEFHLPTGDVVRRMSDGVWTATRVTGTDGDHIGIQNHTCGSQWSVDLNTGRACGFGATAAMRGVWYCHVSELCKEPAIPLDLWLLMMRCMRSAPQQDS